VMLRLHRSAGNDTARLTAFAVDDFALEHGQRVLLNIGFHLFKQAPFSGIG
jgi:hypothetical protein